MFNRLTDTFTLPNGYPIPCVEFATRQTPRRDQRYKNLKLPS